MTAKTPAEATAFELADFAAFVRAGGEVASDGLEQRIRLAEVLFFVHDEKCLVGIAALKRPEFPYRSRIFEKAKATRHATPFPFELGWVFVLPSSRGRRLSYKLTAAAVAHSAGRGVFATSRTDNPAMHASLLAAGFERHGEPYPSNRASHRLELFLYGPCEE